MNTTIDTKGLNGRLVKNTKLYAWFEVIVLLWSFLFIGADCDSSAPPPPPPPQYTYTWTIDTLIYDISGYRPPNRFVVQSIWGSSPHDVWAVAPSDVPWGELWHYDGKKWRAVQWPWLSTDEIGLYGGYLYATTGFDSANVFFFGSHRYNDSEGTAAVYKWSNNNWGDVPWKDGKRAIGGIAWGVKQNNNKLWAIVATGVVIKYENGFLSEEPRVTDYRLSSPVIAALENGEVYLNPFKDSIQNGHLRGSITKLYKRDLSGNWLLVENKFIAGSDYDDNGLGRGLISTGNRLFSDNRGIWEKIDTGWIKRLNIYGLGGQILHNENDIWIYVSKELWHQQGVEWNKININLLESYPDYYLFGEGWSNGQEVFIGFTDLTKSFVLHGKKKQL